ncbi:family 1 glycosylhydrolase, partial [Candidatus Saccharibacteria bacterium]|nr:family 1 glycosylhydrolase [Candidatus Saccharibacteria bacterium]
MIHADAKFPKRFLWGAATSAHQVEGGNHNQWTVWELENARVLATQAEYQYSELPVWPRIKDIARHPAN